MSSNLYELGLRQEEEIKELLREIDKFKEDAKKGNSDKKIKKRFLSKIGIIEELEIQNNYNFKPNDERIRVLGTYELYIRYKK